MALDKQWIVKEPGNPALVRNLASELGVDQALANLLVQRNVSNFSQAKSFFRPQLEDLHDPFLMKDMD
ncbi:MAG TPA: single-stranded-DNA-specific exonuclease RecJ, partial [Bacteroidales bacterium]|nr:single-stranded-DNA-specific exonuclease RecJ [Bacteroidales bacterium]